jgi:hypothetical protein
MLNRAILPYVVCFGECMRSTLAYLGSSPGEGKSGAKVGILNRKVAHLIQK